MADIRINALATTAASTASDDFIAIDGSANGTRKLNAYSPTFGGNLTVSGTGTFAGAVTINTNASTIGVSGTGTGGNWRFKSDDGNTRWLAGLLGSAGETTFSIYDLVNSRQTLALTAAGNATLAGNLTVSGTGNSSIAGNLLFNTSTARGILTINKTASDTLSTANAAAFIGQPDNLEAGLLMQQTASTPYSFVLQGRSPNGTYQFPISLNPQGGNLLIGTTTDAGGKLQIATGASNTLLIGNDATYTSYNQISLNGTRTNSGVLGMIGGGAGDSQLYLLAPTGGGLVFQIAASTVFSVNSSGNATFAGQITASGISHKLGSGGTGSANAVLTIDGSSASSYGSYIVLQRNSTNKWQFGTYSGINGGTSDDFLLYNPTAANEALKIAAATSNATFAGAIAIGNTVNTVSPTSPNRTITMVIGGTTYYIHAKTTND